MVNQPQAFTDMLDPTSRALMSGITNAHTNGASLQETIRQEARQLQQTVHERFISLNKVRTIDMCTLTTVKRKTLMHEENKTS